VARAADREENLYKLSEAEGITEYQVCCPAVSPYTHVRSEDLWLSFGCEEQVQKLPSVAHIMRIIWLKSDGSNNFNLTSILPKPMTAVSSCHSRHLLVMLLLQAFLYQVMPKTCSPLWSELQSCRPVRMSPHLTASNSTAALVSWCLAACIHCNGSSNSHQS